MAKTKSGISTLRGVAVAPTAIVDPRAHIGKGTIVWHFSQIMHHARIGTNCVVGNGVFIDRRVVVGNNVKIQNRALLYRGLRVEDDCFIGPGVCFANDPYPRSNRTRRITKPLWKLGKGVSVGAGAIILADVNIGAYALVGAGAVVTKDVPPHALVIGNPARLRGYVCLCGKVLTETSRRGYYCKACKKVINIRKR